jgi:ribosomal subunit interface protein
MHLEITFRNVDPNDTVKKRAEKKLAKVAKHLLEPVDAHLVFKNERHLFSAEVTVTGGGGDQRFTVTETTDDILSVVDRVMEKLEGVVQRHRERAIDRSHAAPVGEPDGFVPAE